MQMRPWRGDLLRLTPENTRYLDRPVRFKVIEARPEVSEYYDGIWLWLDGYVLGEDGSVWFQPMLVRLDAVAGARLNDASDDEVDRPDRSDGPD
jgi:hypothetical protein